MNQLLDRLFATLSSEPFLAMRGLANEVPLFIQPYNVEEEDQVAEMLRALGQRLRAAGIGVAEVDLFQLLLDELRTDEILDALCDEDCGYERRDLLGNLKNYASAQDRIVPRLVGIMGQEGVRLTLVSGVGHVFPFLRAHTLLETIQPTMPRHPLVLFFPGEYIQAPGVRSELRLFGLIKSEGHYRAFNLDHHRIAPS